MHSKAIIPEIIGLLFCTSALILPVGGRFLGFFKDESASEKLFKETNVQGLTHIDVLGILKKVEQPDKVELCDVSVTRLLKYEDTTCKFEHLSNPDLVNKHSCDNNLGLMTFLRHYVGELNKSCDENYFKILEEAFKEIPAEDVSQFKLLENKSIFVRVNIVEKAEKSMAKWDQDEIFPSCARFIQKMSVAVVNPRWKYEWEKDSVNKPKWFQDWYNVLERCRIYTEIQCEPYARCFLPPTKTLKPAEDTSPQWFERIELCYAIRDKNESDRTRKLGRKEGELKDKDEAKRLEISKKMDERLQKFNQKKVDPYVPMKVEKKKFPFPPCYGLLPDTPPSSPAPPSDAR